MSIWKKPISVEQLTASGANTAVSHLGIELTEVGDDFLRGRVPVDERTRQPFGLLHGGVSVVLAETLGSMGNAAQLSLSGIFLTGYWVLVIRTSRGYRLWDLRGGSTKRRMFFLMAASLAGMAPGVCDPELHSHSSTM